MFKEVNNRQVVQGVAILINCFILVADAKLLEYALEAFHAEVEVGAKNHLGLFWTEVV